MSDRNIPNEQKSPSDWDRFKASDERCFFCFLGWQKYQDVHLHPSNLGHVECDALTALEQTP